MEETALILEGGGMRGIYTAGVLDYLLEEGIEFKYCNSVSAGACNGISYVSKQKGRSYRVNVDYIKDKRYLSMRNYIKTGSLFGMDMLFNTIPNELVPFDYEAFKQSNMIFNVGVTNCETGESEFYQMKDLKDNYTPIKASISLPLAAPIVEYQGKKLLDGGVAQPIPIYQAVKDGYKKHFVVMTQHKAYRKSPTKIVPVLKRTYKAYPRLVEAMARRHQVYNDTLSYIEKLECADQCLVVRPSKPLEIGRFERNPDKLKAAYVQGFNDAKAQRKQIERFLKQA